MGVLIHSVGSELPCASGTYIMRAVGTRSSYVQYGGSGAWSRVNTGAHCVGAELDDDALAVLLGHERQLDELHLRDHRVLVDRVRAAAVELALPRTRRLLQPPRQRQSDVGAATTPQRARLAVFDARGGRGPASAAQESERCRQEHERRCAGCVHGVCLRSAGSLANDDANFWGGSTGFVALLQYVHTCSI